MNVINYPLLSKEKIQDRKEYYHENQKEQNKKAKDYYWQNPEYCKYKIKYAKDYRKAYK